MEVLVRDSLEWGMAGKAMSGNSESGDRFVCQILPKFALIAVVDGLGHGPHAASAACMACQVLESNVEDGVISLTQRCHEKLRGTRGVAMSLASFDFVEGSLTWLSVGNVRGILLPASGPWGGREESVFQCSGVVGSYLPRLHADVLSLSLWDTVVFATDGIDGDFDREQLRGMHPQKAAERILDLYGHRYDDALILIARYKGMKK